MKVGKVVATDSSSVRIKIQGGDAGALALVLVAVAGVVGAVKIYQMHAELQKEIEKLRQ